MLAITRTKVCVVWRNCRSDTLRSEMVATLGRSVSSRRSADVSPAGSYVDRADGVRLAHQSMHGLNFSVGTDAEHLVDQSGYRHVHNRAPALQHRHSTRARLVAVRVGERGAARAADHPTGEGGHAYRYQPAGAVTGSAGRPIIAVR